MHDNAPTLLWLRRDLRLSDNPALFSACLRGGPVVPVFIRDPIVDALGAAPKWRLGLSLQELDTCLKKLGSRLIFRSGDALTELSSLVKETGAGAVYWSRLYDRQSIQRDSSVKAALAKHGVEARSFNGHLLFEPWTVNTKQGKFYKVYSPYWRAVRNIEVAQPLSAPERLNPPKNWPQSDQLDQWKLGAAMQRGEKICRAHQNVGEKRAQERLICFMRQTINDYTNGRNMVADDGTSGLSENLSYGEISVRHCWTAGVRAMDEGSPGAETWLKELVWREFAYHLFYHTPHIAERSWREEWQYFPWREEEDSEDVKAWKMGRTGEPFVDAAMREMYVTGKMHNRARMVVASYLTKHLLIHWRIGANWFADCLTDWDAASNALGWQWTAGSGPDATPYFRIFNPETQAEKFDPDGAYRRRWIAEGYSSPTKTAQSYFQAIPCQWSLSASDSYPHRCISLKDGRNRALAVYQNRKT